MFLKSKLMLLWGWVRDLTVGAAAMISMYAGLLLFFLCSIFMGPTSITQPSTQEIQGLETFWHSVDSGVIVEGSPEALAGAYIHGILMDNEAGSTAVPDFVVTMMPQSLQASARQNDGGKFWQQLDDVREFGYQPSLIPEPVNESQHGSMYAVFLLFGASIVLFIVLMMPRFVLFVTNLKRYLRLELKDRRQLKSFYAAQERRYNELSQKLLQLEAHEDFDTDKMQQELEGIRSALDLAKGSRNATAIVDARIALLEISIDAALEYYRNDISSST